MVVPRPLIRLSASQWVQLAIEPRSAFTDTLSNAVSLKNVDAARFLVYGSVEDLAASDHLVRLFLHEATHHASFAGPVGHAFAALACSSSGLSGPGVSLLNVEKGLRLGLRDRLILEWMNTVYAPLIKGLAVFAEYDLYSGPINHTSHALLHAESLYLRSVVQSSVTKATVAFTDAVRAKTANADTLKVVAEVREAVLNDHLRHEVRLTAGALEQKETLLRQPLIRPPGGERQYLLGYLATKRAYVTLRKAQPVALRSTDIFHMLMLNHWFGDSEIVLPWLSVDDCDPYVVQQHTIGTFLERFQDRWDTLYNHPLAHLKTLQNRLEKGVRQQSEDELGLLEFLYGLRTAPQGLNVFAPKLLKHRLTLRHAITPIEVSVDRSVGMADIRDRSSNAILGRCPAVKLADVGTYAATVELVQSYDLAMQAVVVLGPTGLVATRCLRTGDWNSSSHVEAFDDLPSLEHVMVAMQEANVNCIQVSDEDPEIQALWQHQREQATEFRDSLYLQLAFPLQRAAREQSARALSQCGFAGVFDTDWAVRQLARYSLVFGGEGNTLEAAAVLVDELPNAMLSRIREINGVSAEKLGVELFEIQDKFVTATV